MTLARILLLLSFSTGCASVSHDAQSARDASPPPGASSTAFVASVPFTASATDSSSDAQTKRDVHARSRTNLPVRRDRAAPPLRRFYLLSPGPNATLVVTRSDLSTR